MEILGIIWYIWELENNVGAIGNIGNNLGISNSYITSPSFVANLLHRKSARAIARGLLRAINQLQNEGM